MIFTAENTTAGNGRRIKSTVELIGSDDERPSWRTEVAVSGDTLYRSHHHTKRGAEGSRSKMHAAYMEVHSATGVQS